MSVFIIDELKAVSSLFIQPKAKNILTFYLHMIY